MELYQELLKCGLLGSRLGLIAAFVARKTEDRDKVGLACVGAKLVPLTAAQDEAWESLCCCSHKLSLGIGPHTVMMSPLWQMETVRSSTLQVTAVV